MPLFEVETDAHIIITWADSEGTATTVANDSYPGESIVRLTKRPRDSWVISKGVLGLTEKADPCGVPQPPVATDSAFPGCQTPPESGRDRAVPKLAERIVGHRRPI